MRVQLDSVFNPTHNPGIYGLPDAELLRIVAEPVHWPDVAFMEAALVRSGGPAERVALYQATRLLQAVNTRDYATDELECRRQYALACETTP